jgi:hypothetical protein
VLLGANALMVLATVWLIGMYARSIRRRLERVGDKRAAEGTA